MNCIIDGRSQIGLESRLKRKAQTLSGVGPPTQLLLGTRYLLTERRDQVRHLTISYADALVKTDSESVGATVRRRRILFEGFVARMGEECLPRRVMFWGDGRE